MMLSEEQARLAVEALRNRHGSAQTAGVEVAPETLAMAREAVFDAPDVRAERVLEACTRLLTKPIDSRDLADKVISRIASDSLR